MVPLGHVGLHTNNVIPVHAVVVRYHLQMHEPDAVGVAQVRGDFRERRLRKLGDEQVGQMVAIVELHE
eukprot:1912560-Prymnesium_polylepis.1